MQALELSPENASLNCQRKRTSRLMLRLASYVMQNEMRDRGFKTFAIPHSDLFNQNARLVACCFYILRERSPKTCSQLEHWTRNQNILRTA